VKIRKKHSRGISALEVVMSAGVLLPLCAAALFLGAKMYQYVFGIISTLVGWPYP
jgi:hypothetical protein